MKGGCVVGVPSCLVRGVPLSVCVAVLLNGGVWWVACCPVFGLGSPFHIVRPSRIVPVPLLSCVAVFVVGGGVWWGTVSRSAFLFSLCVLCYSIVGLVLCLCVRVV